MDLAAAAPPPPGPARFAAWVCCGPAGAAGGRGPERPRATQTERPRYHRERADASVRCTGLGATTSESTWHVQGYCFD